MRRLSLVALLIGIALVPLAYGIAANEHDRRVSEMRRTLALRADEHAGKLDAYFLRARSVILLTANQPAFRHIDEAAGTRDQKVRAGGRDLADATAALRELERLYPSSIGEACFIDASGSEAARVVRGRVARPAELSTQEAKAPFFAPTLALRQGQVHQARPYVSPDTREWVVANATPTPSRDGVTRSMVHFEVTIESFRRAAEAEGQDIELRVVEASTGRVVFEGGRQQRVGAALGVPGDRRFVPLARSAGRAGIVDVDGRPSAYHRVRRGTGNANDWLLVATTGGPVPSLGDSLGIAPAGMLLVALLLAGLGAFGLRSQGRELRSAAETDLLTGLRNRRRLLEDVERRIARASAEPAILMLFDLNGFKTYNDTFGHVAGDALLARLGGALDAAVTPAGRAYRLGGDEFCVLGDAAARLHMEPAALGALTEQGERFEVTAASGAALIPAEAETATDALRLADQRMYACKVGTRLGADRQSKDVLIRVLEERHPELGEHGGGVADLAVAVASELGLDEQQGARVRHAAELHDIGKVAIPDAILRKPGPLDDDEWAFIRRHPVIGERILAGAPALAPVAELVRASHERYDGAGYPDGLAGAAIPLGGRIVAVCDAFHAMLADRPYSPPRTVDDALAELRRCAGEQFDPAVVDAFAAVLVAGRLALSV
jgi:diguanylate cyclase (GGDEF)-like protein